MDENSYIHCKNPFFLSFVWTTVTHTPPQSKDWVYTGCDIKVRDVCPRGCEG